MKPRSLLLILLVTVLPSAVYAHTANLELERAPAGEVALFYGRLGFEHILPAGLDHILFILALCFLNTKLKSILWQSTVFTLAHSITLALSLGGSIELPARIVEPLIALSIVFVAVENLLHQQLSARRLVVVFLFGLIHGLGFGAALAEVGLPRNQFLTSVVSFNVGVELGQLAIVLLVFCGIILPLRKRVQYRRWIVYPASVLIAAVAAFWTVERLVYG